MPNFQRDLKLVSMVRTDPFSDSFLTPFMLPDFDPSPKKTPDRARASLVGSRRRQEAHSDSAGLA